MKKSSELPPAAAAPTIGSPVTRSKCPTPAERLIPSTADPLTHTDEIEALNEITGKDPWRNKGHQLCSITPSPLSTPGKDGHCIVSELAPTGVSRLNAILTDPHGTKHG